MKLNDGKNHAVNRDVTALNRLELTVADRYVYRKPTNYHPTGEKMTIIESERIMKNPFSTCQTNLFTTADIELKLQVTFRKIFLNSVA